MKKPVFPVLIIAAIIMASCGGRQNASSANSSDGRTPSKGIVIPEIKCEKNPSVSYSLYLPTLYNGQKKFPVILAFDPHGTGELPVQKYQALAEQYGYILFGSNNSKNGQAMSETESIVSSMFTEITSKYAVDTARIYLMGFSGGSRIASLVAFYGGGIRGVIGCGAGFPGTEQPGRFRFDYLGMAGNADFNMNELVNLDSQLEKEGWRHALIVFDGIHEWPSLPVMDKAFIWNEFCAMRNKLIPEKKMLLTSYRKDMEEKIKKDESLKDVVSHVNDLTQLIRFTDGLINTDTYKRQLSLVKNSAAYQMEEKSMQVLKEKEMKQQQMFVENFFLKDLDWWKKQTEGLETQISNGKDPAVTLMDKRILSYLSLLAYMKYNAASGAGDREKASIALSVYRIVDPENAAKIK